MKHVEHTREVFLLKLKETTTHVIGLTKTVSLPPEGRISFGEEVTKAKQKQEDILSILCYVRGGGLKPLRQANYEEN